MKMESSTHRIVRAGIACADLVAYPERWINRRVETIEMLTQEETRRRVSIDFTLKDEQLKELTIDDGVVIPISVLTKEARRNFSLRDESGRSVPVLGRQQNGELAQIALLSAAQDALPPNPAPEVIEEVAADVRQVVYGSPDDAADALGFIIGRAESGDEWRAMIWADATCRRLLESLWVNYVLFAVLPVDGPNRRVLKYSYGDDFNLATDGIPFTRRLRLRELASRLRQPDRRPFVIECPGAWRARSFHAEIVVPEELRIETAVLWDFDADAPRSTFDDDVNRAALYASHGVDPEAPVAAFVEVAPERIGRTTQAAVTSLAVAALLWLGVESGLDAKNPGAAVSILLAGAALFSGITAAQGEHVLVRRAFAASRRWLAIVSIAALVGSATLAMELPDEHPVGVWRIAAIVASLAAVRLNWSAIRAAG